MKLVSFLVLFLSALFSAPVLADATDARLKANSKKAALPNVAVSTSSSQVKLDSNQAVKAYGASSQLNVLRQIEGSRTQPSRLPQQRTTDAAAGTKLESRGNIGRGQSKDVDELVREVLGLGGDGFNAAGIRRLDGGFNAAKYGSGTAAGAAGAPTDKGHSSSQGSFGRLDYGSNRTSSGSMYTARFVHVNGNVSQVGESWSNNKFGGDTYVATHTVTDGRGNVTYQAEHTEVTDKNGEVISQTDRESGTPLSADDQDDLNQAVDEIVAELNNAGQDAPTDNATGKGGPCNPVSGIGCEKRKSNHMDKVSQPVHGNEIKTLAGAGGRPNAGPSSVTDPGNHDGSSSRSGGRSGGTPGGDATDPEEIIPGAGVGPST